MPFLPPNQQCERVQVGNTITLEVSPAEERGVYHHQTRGSPRHRQASNHIPPTAERCMPAYGLLHHARHSVDTH